MNSILLIALALFASATVHASPANSPAAADDVYSQRQDALQNREAQEQIEARNTQITANSLLLKKGALQFAEAHSGFVSDPICQAWKSSCSMGAGECGFDAVMVPMPLSRVEGSIHYMVGECKMTLRDGLACVVSAVQYTDAPSRHLSAHCYDSQLAVHDFKLASPQ